MGSSADLVGCDKKDPLVDEFDYTKWQREHYDAMSPDEIHSGVVRNGDEHPFRGKKAVII